MLLPSGKRVEKHTPIYPGSFFSWAEATGDCTRPIMDLILNGKIVISAFDIEKKIVATARELDRIRHILGDRPLHVNSWYRPRHINRQVGGASDSRHQFGDAVDFRSNYFYPQHIYRLLDKSHNRGGLSAYPAFVHIDFRGKATRW